YAQCVEIPRHIAFVASGVRTRAFDLRLRLIELESRRGPEPVTLLREREPFVLITHRRFGKLFEREIVRGDEKRLRHFRDQADLQAPTRGFLREEVFERRAIETSQTPEEVELECRTDGCAVLLHDAFSTGER